MNSLSTELGKWWWTIKVTWSKLAVYKSSFTMMFIFPSLMFFFIKYNLWHAIYFTNDITEIKGYTWAQMIQYQFWILIIGLLTGYRYSSDVSVTVRLGGLSKHLLHPFSFTKFYAAHILGTVFISCLIILFTVFLAAQTDILPSLALEPIAKGIFFGVLISLFWALIQLTVGILSFWLEETWMIFVVFQILSQFLSGALFPIELYPEWLQTALSYSPFPYLVYVPVKILMNEYNQNILLDFIILSGWVFLTFQLYRFLWKKGLKGYTGAGM